jgi:hypothetical protein
MEMYVSEMFKVSTDIHIKLRKQSGGGVWSFDMELKDLIYCCTHGI